MNANKHAADERGFVLAITLFMMAMLTGLTAAALRMSQTDIQIGKNYRSASQGLYAAEAGIKHAVALINQAGVVNLRSEVVNTWPNGQAPFAASPNPMARQTMFSYDVTIVPDPYSADPDRALLSATGMGADNTVRVVSARIKKSPDPYDPPGALYLATDSPTDATFNGNAFLVDGNDKYDGVSGPKSPVPGITTRSEANAEETRSSLSSAQEDNVLGLGYVAGPPPTPSVAAGAGPTAAQVSQIIDDLLALPGVDSTTCTGNLNGNLTFGTAQAPKITYCNDPSGTTIKGSGNASGAGILIVESALAIQGTLDFRGLILVRGSTGVTGNASVQGSLWTTDFNVTVGGNAIVQYSSQALALAMQAGGGADVLPAPVDIIGWRDVF